MTHIASVGSLDATTLAEKLRDQLPTGSAQNYAAMLVLNYLDSYSEKDGLQIEEQGRLAVTALSLEFLYLAWYNDVGIELSERQLENWPSHVWKNSASLGINLHSLVKRPNLRLIHDRLRDVRTLLSFGAVVNQYYKLIQTQMGGLKAFVQTYQPIEPEELEFPSPLPSPLPLYRSSSGTYSIGSNSKANNSGWKWFPWVKDKPPKNQSTAPLEPLEIPGLMPQPPVEVLRLYIAESTDHFHLVSHETASGNSLSSSLITSCESGLTLSSGTNESIATTQISALERLEAYLSVLGTPQCEPIKRLLLRKPRLVPLAVAEKAAKVHMIEEPFRKPLQLPLVPLTVIVQRELPGPRNKLIRSLRWMTGEELKSRKVVWKQVDHKLDVLKGNKRLPKPELELVKAMMSRNTEPGIIVVGKTDSSSELPSISPLKIVKGSKVGSD